MRKLIAYCKHGKYTDILGAFWLLNPWEDNVMHERTYRTTPNLPLWLPIYQSWP